VILINKLNLISYLEEKKIFITNSKWSSNRIENKTDLFKQIDNIVYFNKIIGSYKENLMPRIKSNIFVEYENYKKQIFILERYARDLKKNNFNKLDQYIFKREKELIKLANKALKVIDDSNSYKLILRSMRNYEVCLNRVDENNLLVNYKGEILIGNIRYLSYNLKEHDIYSFIKRIKRKNINISVDEIINYYIEKENLDEDSRSYIYGLSIYPNEEMRIIEKHIRNKLLLNEEEAIEALYIAREVDFKLLDIRERE